ncbi:uncharacterized protein Z518_07456 [Rhinocladiella mackenziei CBS 650.93]|uniref:DUF7923 domain-containing protein n=1 Tax=Rhinocladiella mackenziei CBS 650.93 TaxID=1442369 RepID=A0A0D2H0F6_9EURO|nr:uncharacterized protein Z518_07456 [Rhinocladiella mackenziei CBS 650.93]KIX03903.1 hypothetical protein Z518_07456 [Rhinocladiella mackenziei CBS 650.93]
MGGEYAADELRKTTREHLSSIMDNSDQLDIVVKAFASLDAVSSTLIRDGKIRDERHFRKVVADFNSRSPFFDFLDVGPGRERADQKIRESLKFYVDTPQCKHILLACCHDAGYAPFLGQLVGDSCVFERVTLIEGDFVAPAFKQLNFKTTSFPSVFMAPDSINGPGQNTKKFTIEVPSQQMDKLASGVVNSSGYRVDIPLSVDENLLKRIKSLNLCHWLFLRGECRGCSRNHAHPPLTDPEFDALWLLARQGFCNKAKQSRCDDIKCIYGHGHGHGQ